MQSILGALAIISLVIAAIYLVFADARKTIDANRAENKAREHINATMAVADSRPTSMPETKWKKLLAAAIQVHCATDGMTKEEVEAALGKPTKVEEYTSSGNGSSSWYVTENKKDCRKYQGHKCVQYGQSETVLSFTQKGHVELGPGGPGCDQEPFFSLNLN